jgi:hypothetical protein
MSFVSITIGFPITLPYCAIRQGYLKLRAGYDFSDVHINFHPLRVMYLCLKISENEKYFLLFAEGLPVETPVKGMYIRNGKVVIVK